MLKEMSVQWRDALITLGKKLTTEGLLKLYKLLNQ